MDSKKKVLFVGGGSEIALKILNKLKKIIFIIYQERKINYIKKIILLIIIQIQI